MRKLTYLASLCALLTVTRAGAAESVPTEPTNLRECYLKVAAQKSLPDAMFIAREICDALFGKLEPRSLVALDPKTSKCVESWFDGDGRYESAELYCAFEPRGEQRFVYACESKDPKVSRFTYVELTRKDTRYERSGKSAGYDPGPLFTGIAACLEHKAGLH